MSILNEELDRQKEKRKKEGNFLTIADKESVEMTIMSYQKALGFENKDTIAFAVKVHSPEGDRDQRFDCTNPYFLQAVDELPKHGVGQRVNVTRDGERKKTKYIIEPIIKREEVEEPDEEL